MKRYIFKEDLNLMYVAAQSFPDDILNAHQILYSLVKDRKNREYFGISFPDEFGKIQYKAAVTENFKEEGFSLGLKTYRLKKGTYNYITIPDYKNDILTIQNAFKILLLSPYLDLNGACVEWHYNKNNVRGMVSIE